MAGCPDVGAPRPPWGRLLPAPKQPAPAVTSLGFLPICGLCADQPSASRFPRLPLC